MSEKHPEAVPSALHRRDFLRVAGLGAAALAAGAAAACAEPEHAGPSADASAQGAAADQPWTRESFELEEVGVGELMDGMASGKWTSRRITQLYLDRIAALDRQGPRLRAVIETNPDALDLADQLDEERQAGKLRGPLHGIPILVKDNIDTADKMVTAAGSLALAGHHAAQDSGVAARLRAAGAILLGKANLSEWANYRSTRSSSGWSGRGGQCGNAFAVDRNPCGSSSGSGAGASANFCAAAIGTETNGSVVCPSSINGVVGIKPTVGLVSRAGIIPISHTQDTAGPIARTVRDAAVLLGAMTGVDARDPATAASQGHAFTDYTQFLDPKGLKGMRIGVERSFFGRDDRVDALMEDALKVMADHGATVVDPATLSTLRAMNRNEGTVLDYEFKADLNKYLTELPRDFGVHTLADIIAFNEAHKSEEMPFFGQEIFLAAEKRGPLTDPEYTRALTAMLRAARSRGIDALMEQHELDAIVSPTTRPAWVTDLVNRDGSSGGSSGPAAIAGYPSITVPNGYVMGLPVGILFFGRAWSEPTLLKIAYAYEQATHHRKAPKLPLSLDLRNAVG
jgi:amidase